MIYLIYSPPSTLHPLLSTFGYPRKAEQVGRDSGALRAPLSRLKLVPPPSTLYSPPSTRSTRSMVPFWLVR